MITTMRSNAQQAEPDAEPRAATAPSPAPRAAPAATAPSSAGGHDTGTPATGAFGHALNAGIAEASASPAAGVQDYLRADAGAPLDGAMRETFGRGFGHDLGDVRIHTGAAADASARSLGARAYAAGNDVVFGAGEYRPDTPDGRWLLAHELSHVVQQGGQAGPPMCKAIEIDGTDTPHERAADAAADRVMAGEIGVGASLSRGGYRISRFVGSFPWAGNHWYSAPNRYEINGSVSGGGGRAAISSGTVTLNVNAGTSGDITLSLSGNYIGPAGSGLTRSIARGTFQLTQRFPFRCTPEGALTVDAAAIVPGAATNDPSHMNPFGIAESEIGMSFNAGSDGSSFLMETINFTSGGSGASVSVGPVGVNTAGGTTNTYAVGLRINLHVVGARPTAPTPTPPPASASANASASASASVSVPRPAPVAVPPTHPVYFHDEGQTVGDEGELVRWAAALAATPTGAAIRTHRLRVTVVGRASTTGTEAANLAHYAHDRSDWVRRVLARTLGIPVGDIGSGNLGSYAAPPADHVAGGVANPLERRADILFDEANPTTSSTTSASSTASASASTPTP